nr:homeobox protein engrailed-1-like [Zonotrichia albicollis]
MAPQRAHAHSRPASPSLPPARHVPAPSAGPGDRPGPARAAPRARGSFSNGRARASLAHRRPSKAPVARLRLPPRRECARGPRRTAPPGGSSGAAPPRHPRAQGSGHLLRERSTAPCAVNAHRASPHLAALPPAGTGHLPRKPSAEEATQSALFPSSEQVLADRPKRGSDCDHGSCGACGRADTDPSHRAPSRALGGVTEALTNGEPGLSPAQARPRQSSWAAQLPPHAQPGRPSQTPRELITCYKPGTSDNKPTKTQF